MIVTIIEEFKGRNRPDEYDRARPVEIGGQAGPIRRDPLANSKLKSLSISVAKSLPLIHECWPRGEEDSDGRVRIAKKLTKLVSPSRRRAFELGAEFYANKPEVGSPGRKRADVGPGNVKILFILLNVHPRPEFFRKSLLLTHNNFVIYERILFFVSWLDDRTLKR
ncbi:hypothetical protein RUM43_004720 [Polyplax serrata]|uniref:Uncharacterized protein n=1 Tax=Polyplax serrata TaxID=468196 RepID=A0AAN8SDP4_POLSC